MNRIILLKKENFRIESIIGSGSFGQVCKAYDIINHRFVCIKQIKKTKDNSFQLQKEIEIFSSLNHPNIVKFYGIFEDNQTFNIVMEYCPHGSLFQTKEYQNKEPFSLEMTRKIMKDLGLAIQYMHSKAFIHRDIKPANMLFDQDYNIKLCDFGLSTALKDINPIRKKFYGTFNYMSPEVIKRRAISRASDIWSFATILYALLVGSLPFDAKTNEEIAQNIMNARYTIPVSVDPVAADLIRRCLVVEPKKRLSIDQVLDHEFFSPKKIEKPLICPFSKGNVKVFDDGSIVLELNGHDDVMRIYNDANNIDIIMKGNEYKRQHYTRNNLPSKLEKRLGIALKIAKEAQVKRPLVIWNTNVGKYVMFGDMSLHLLFNKKLYPVFDQPSIENAMIQMVKCVKESSDPQFPIVVGTSK